MDEFWDHYAKLNEAVTKGKYYMTSFIWGTSNRFIEAENRWCLIGTRGNGELLFNGYSFTYARWLNSRDLLYNTVSIQYAILFSIVSNTILHTEEFFKRVDFMFRLLTTIKEKKLV